MRRPQSLLNPFAAMQHICIYKAFQAALSTFIVAPQHVTFIFNTLILFDIFLIHPDIRIFFALAQSFSSQNHRSRALTFFLSPPFRTI